VKKDSVTYEIRKIRPESWVPLTAISRYTKWAIILSEDWSFYQHEGLDLEQIQAALAEMMTAGIFRGASTITQQLVKNLYLSEERTLWRKLNEAILTFKVEGVLSKNQILEMYLNVIEFGPGVYGISAATAFYFRKSPGQLNPRESAFLAMLLPSPKRYSVSFRKKKLSRFARKRMEAILKKLRMAKVITREEYAAEVRRKLDWEF
jgi:monofunctional biosynthetic peptidoglycan transglycosylase